MCVLITANGKYFSLEYQDSYLIFFSSFSPKFILSRQSLMHCLVFVLVGIPVWAVISLKARTSQCCALLCPEYLEEYLAQGRTQ